ncbi:MAG: GatB/YqeY domain-containing protein [Woeseia sp.]
MTLKSRISGDTRSAMKAGDKDRLKVLRLIHAAIQQIEVDTRTELDDSGVLGVLDKMVRQRRDSVSQFRDGGRQDLADIELAEIEVLQTYLPEQLGEAELDAIVEQAIADSGAESMRDMGKVMARVKEKAAGRADMAEVSASVKKRLGAV